MVDDGQPNDHLKQECEHLNRALKMALAANHALMQSTGELQLFQEVCNIAVEIGGYRMAWIGYVEHNEAKTIRPVTHAGSETGYLQSVDLSWGDGERGKGPAGTAARTGQFVISRNIATDPSFQPWRENALERGFASSIALPIKKEERVIGELSIYSSEPDAFDTHEVEILQELANDLGIGIALVRARHRREIAEGRATELGVALDAAIIDAMNNEILFRSIYENTPLGILRFDSNWRYLSVNPAYTQMVGYSEAELLTMTIMDVTHPGDREITAVNRIKLDAGEMPVLKGFEKRYITKSGKVIWARITGRKLKIAGHDKSEWLAVVEDITERRELEAKLEIEQRKSLQSAKLASLGEMSVGIAHELSNPLTIVLGSFGLLERERLEPERFHKALSAAIRAGEKILRIVNGLTHFSRRSEFSQMKPAPLAAIVADVAEMMASTANRFGVALRLDLQNGLSILCNEIEIAQVLQNLVANAIDAVKSSTEKWVRVKLFENEGRAVLQIIDSGPGVAGGLEEKIFEAFYTTKPAGNGTGLGLSIVRAIVNSHGGTVELLRLDSHTCFQLRFRLTD